MFRRGLAAFALSGALLSATPLAAVSHLVPSGDPPDRYHKLLFDYFARGRSSGALVQGIIVPSFTNERSVSIRRRAGGYELVVLEAKAHLWRYEMIAGLKEGGVSFVDPNPIDEEIETAHSIYELSDGLPEDPMLVPMHVCTAELDRRTATAAIEVWNLALEDARDSTPEELENQDIVVDGTSFDFWAKAGGEELRGSSYSPMAGVAGELSGLAWRLAAYCEGEIDELELRTAATRALSETR